MAKIVRNQRISQVNKKSKKKCRKKFRRRKKMNKDNKYSNNKLSIIEWKCKDCRI